MDLEYYKGVHGIKYKLSDILKQKRTGRFCPVFLNGLDKVHVEFGIVALAHNIWIKRIEWVPIIYSQ